MVLVVYKLEGQGSRLCLACLELQAVSVQMTCGWLASPPCVCVCVCVCVCSVCIDIGIHVRWPWSKFSFVAV